MRRVEDGCGELAHLVVLCKSSRPPTTLMVLNGSAARLMIAFCGIAIREYSAVSGIRNLDG